MSQLQFEKCELYAAKALNSLLVSQLQDEKCELDAAKALQSLLVSQLQQTRCEWDAAKALNSLMVSQLRQERCALCAAKALNCLSVSQQEHWCVVKASPIQTSPIHQAQFSQHNSASAIHTKPNSVKAQFRSPRNSVSALGR